MKQNSFPVLLFQGSGQEDKKGIRKKIPLP